MNQASKAETTPLEVNYSDIANKYYNADEATVSEYVSDLADQSAANNNEPKLTLLARFYNFFEQWTEQSYEAWKKAGKPPRDYI
jgi:hypothetical protein